MRKFITLILAAVFTVGLIVPVGAADDGSGGGVPYLNFTYDYWGNIVPSPAAYVPTISIGGPDIDPSIGRFDSPQDMFVDANGDIYLMDTGNNRLVVFNRDLELRLLVDKFDNNGETDTFNTPFGVTVSNNTFDIYIADTENRRVVMLDKDGKLLSIFENPETGIVNENFVFLPLKVALDPADRLYVIVRNEFEGIMSFDVDGTFFGYFGTVNVSPSLWDRFWRLFQTQAQRSVDRLWIPVEFRNMDVDRYGFVYTTNIETSDTVNKVKRLNPSGQDVLANMTELYITGDQNYRPFGRLGQSASFEAIKARPNGMYSALDSSRSRLFTYDSEGNMLYVISGHGNALGMGRFPVAVEILDNSILILDRQRGEIVYFEETEYGRLINEAIALRYDGDESAAVDKWREVLTLNENYTLAYTGIGKALLAGGDNVEAMEFLRKGMSVQYYSIAFKRHRNDILKENLNMVFTLVALFIAAVVAFKLFKAYKNRIEREAQELAENEARAARIKRQSEDIKRADL
jgi:tetratricopeptide (TPR) repeat protein